MSIRVTHATKNKMPAPLLRGMYGLRHKVFNEKLNWDVEDFGGIEIDQFDYQNPNYIVAQSNNKNIIGCWRLLPTTERYMLEEVFDFLLGNDPLPKDEKIWELSRFVVDDKRSEGRVLSEATLKMIKEIILFAKNKEITSYVTVTSTGVERLMKTAGIPIKRIGTGKPVPIGRVKSVLCSVPINQEFINSVDKLLIKYN